MKNHSAFRATISQGKIWNVTLDVSRTFIVEGKFDITHCVSL